MKCYDCCLPAIDGKTRCPLCAEKAREYARAHLEKAHERNRRWYQAHSEKHCERSRRYRQAHPEKHREYIRRYQQAHPEKHREYVRRYYARKLGAPTDNHTAAQLQTWLEPFGGRCFYSPWTGCGGKFEHLDHMTPLSRGGAHALYNLVPACAACNCSKNDLTALEFLARLRQKKIS